MVPVTARALPPPLTNAVQRDILHRYAAGATVTELTIDGIDRALANEVIAFARHDRSTARRMVRDYDRRLAQLRAERVSRREAAPVTAEWAAIGDRPDPARSSLEQVTRERDEARAEVRRLAAELEDLRARTGDGSVAAEGGRPVGPVLSRYYAWLCPSCGSRYSRHDREHPCGRLTPVEVLIVRREVAQ